MVMNTKIPKGYMQTEVGVIPENWEVKKLGDIGTFKNGINKGKEDFGFGHPFVNLLDVFGRTKLSSNSSFGLVNSTQKERSEYDLRKGDVLFVRSSVKPEGVGITSLIAEDLPDSVYSGFLIRLRDFEALDLGYKEYCFYEEGFRRKLIDNSTVSANTNINQDALKNLQIPLPPPAEQQAIAEALSAVDALIAALERLIAKKRHIKQGAIQALLTGKKRLPGFPGDWEVKRQEEVVKYINGRAYKRSEWEKTGTPVIRLQNLTGTGEEYYYSTLNLPEHQYIDNGDLIFMWSASFGPFIWKGGRAIYHYHIWKIECNESVVDKQFYYYKLEELTETLRNQTNGSTMLHITKGNMEQYELSIPSLPEQQAIAQTLSDMDAEIEALEQERDKYKAIKQGMMQELLTGRVRLLSS